MATLQALHDAEAIRAYLNRQPMRHIYELGDLDPFFGRRPSGMAGWTGQQSNNSHCCMSLAGHRCC